MAIKEDAATAYLAVPGGIDSYYGWLASERLTDIGGSKGQSLVQERLTRNKAQAEAATNSYPAPYRQAILSATKTRKLDPRFVLAIIKQESVFRPTAKSPAGARGLLQLTIDAAHKYAAHAGVKGLVEGQLYQPETSILIGSEYLKELFDMFPTSRRLWQPPTMVGNTKSSAGSNARDKRIRAFLLLRSDSTRLRPTCKRS